MVFFRRKQEDDQWLMYCPKKKNGLPSQLRGGGENDWSDHWAGTLGREGMAKRIRALEGVRRGGKVEGMGERNGGSQVGASCAGVMWDLTTSICGGGRGKVLG